MSVQNIFFQKNKTKLLLFIILTRFTRCNMQGVAHNHCGVIVTVLSNRRRGAGVRGILGYVRCAVFRFSLEGHKRKFYTRVQLVSRLFSDRKHNNHNTTIVAHSRIRVPVQFSSLRGVYAPFIVLFCLTVCKSLSLCSHQPYLHVSSG